MPFVVFTALRYLFGRSRLGAAGWISLISAVAIAVVTAALVCVLSVYNGYVALLLSGEVQSMPELLIKPREGKICDFAFISNQLQESNLVQAHSAVLQTQGVLRSGEVQTICEVYGVDEDYTQVVAIDSGLREGHFLLSKQEYDEGLNPATVGIALAGEGIVPSLEGGRVSLLFPRRQGLINPLAVASGFVDIPLSISGVLPPYNEQINRRIYIAISALREALNYDGQTVSAVALRPKEGISTEEVQAGLRQRLGADYLVLNREEQQPELTFLIKTEKVMVYAIMCFILVLATFNLASSLAMLVMEKGQDIQTLRALGASVHAISTLFALTGVFISGIGSVCGLVLGTAFCYLQQSFGFISSGEGLSRMVFPIDMRWQDIIYIILATFVVTSLSAIIPAGFISKRSEMQA